MTITLNQTNPTGQTWTYKIPKADKILRVTSSSPYFLYEVTPNELIIKAKLESQTGDTITATDGTTTNTYTLDKTGIIDPRAGFEVYYGSSASAPTNHSTGTRIVVHDEFTFTATQNYGWFALPVGKTPKNVIETSFLTSWKDQLQTVIDENWTIYYINFFSTSHNTELKVIL